MATGVLASLLLTACPVSAIIGFDGQVYYPVPHRRHRRHHGHGRHAQRMLNEPPPWAAEAAGDEAVRKRLGAEVHHSLSHHTRRHSVRSGGIVCPCTRTELCKDKDLKPFEECVRLVEESRCRKTENDVSALEAGLRFSDAWCELWEGAKRNESTTTTTTTSTTTTTFTSISSTSVTSAPTSETTISATTLATSSNAPSTTTVSKTPELRTGTAFGGWSNQKKEDIPMPEQGFHGRAVEHNDMQTATSDWLVEHGGKDSYSRACAKYASNWWCELHGYALREVGASRSDSSRW
eukprot:CAMPEP_0179096600 /NCGR_PEP_ID=MMETSP0796-20121207/44418_1 /TAXON_ID=73915 /ORGANISM="Pyrodinium bahamense, Strain pbaha01" /LENGTH=292 /DNA_ID=CAMNT_0020794325 /DNA_START=74 /DNA_END=949 /DNA_ORIENTATION=+